MNISKEEVKGLWDKYRQEFMSPLRELLDPDGVINDPFNMSVRGKYDKEWETNLAGRLKVAGIGIMFFKDEMGMADDFFRRVLYYVRSELPKFTPADKSAIKEYECRLDVSNCFSAEKGAQKEREILEANGFYIQLDKVYATLEVLAAVSLGDSIDYRSSFMESLSPLTTGDVPTAREKLSFELQKQKQEVRVILRSKYEYDDFQHDRDMGKNFDADENTRHKTEKCIRGIRNDDREEYINSIISPEGFSLGVMERLKICSGDMFQTRRKAQAFSALHTHLKEAYGMLHVLMGEGIRPEDVQKGYEKYTAAMSKED